MNKLLVICLLALGCTDTTRASWGAYGRSGHITCYSGGKITYEGDSTGRIATVDNSDGWEFQEAGSSKFIRVSGACVIKN